MRKAARKARDESVSRKELRRREAAHENKDSADMRRVERDWSSWGPEDRPQVGDFTIYDAERSKKNPYRAPESADDRLVVKMIVMMLPGSHVCVIPIRPVPAFDKPLNDGHSWQWDGNLEKPTLTPSVHAVGRWHGHVKAGRMVSC